MNTFTKNIVLKTVFALALFFVLIPAVNAQVEVTFKVNLQPQLKDSIYVPGRDQIFLKGNIFPLSNTKKVYLKDTAPVDSVFEATVDFPPSTRNDKLKYNFYIYTPEKLMNEQMPRYLQLRKGKKELDALYFNTFAW